MKIKPGFILRKVAGEIVVLPTQGTANLDMMIALNGSACFLWEQLAEETDVETLVKKLLEKYDVDEATAREAVVEFVEKLKTNDLLA